MLPSTLKITLDIVLIVYFIIIVYFLKKKSIELRYTLLWIFCGVIMAFMLFFPETFTKVINVFGITGTMNGLYLMFIAFLMMICMSLTAIVSAQSRKIRTLVQQLAIVEKRVNELEKHQEIITKSKE